MFNFNAIAQTFLLLMNTPLVPLEEKETMNVQLTDMPTRKNSGREDRRRSTGSTTSSGAISDTSSMDISRFSTDSEGWFGRSGIGSQPQSPRLTNVTSMSPLESSLIDAGSGVQVFKP